MIYTVRNIILFFMTFSLTLGAYAQDVIEDSFASNPEARREIDAIPLETIQKISPSRRIFVLSNTNESFYEGDYISLVFNDELTVRALCAKLTDGIAGVKIVNIYNEDMWEKLAESSQVRVIRGDDSFFNKLKKSGGEQLEGLLAEDEDLFNETILQDDLELKENTKRVIKTDNVIGLSYGVIEGLDSTGNAASYDHYHASWAYQLSDNIWGEVLLGQSIARAYPADDLDTTLLNFTLKLKYTTTAPFDSYFQPYVGYQIVDADSPNAGVQVDPSLTQKTAEELANELDDVEAIKKSQYIFGATILKRLVPGWFANLTVGLDVVSLGLALEF